MNEIGVISWNVHGDHRDGAGPDRVNELNTILTHLEAAGWPVGFLCFQETCGIEGSLMPWLTSQGYQCRTLREGAGTGMWYLFALHPNSGFSFFEEPKQILFHYTSATGSPLRYPALAKLKALDGTAAGLYTFHASLDGALVEGLEKYSENVLDAVGSEDFDSIYVTGDLNITSAYEIFDEELEENVNFIEKLFGGFAGTSNKLDHIFRWPELTEDEIDGCCYDTSSDHELLYAKFKID